MLLTSEQNHAVNMFTAYVIENAKNQLIQVRLLANSVDADINSSIFEIMLVMKNFQPEHENTIKEIAQDINIETGTEIIPKIISDETYFQLFDNSSIFREKVLQNSKLLYPAEESG
jgi:hypothetical protein